MTQIAVVRDKEQFYALFSTGRTGNKTQSWDYPVYLGQTVYNGGCGIRLKIPNSPYMRYDLGNRRQVMLYAEHLIRDIGVRAEEIVVSELAPDQDLTIQVEVMRSERYLDLMYSDVPGLRMREAMAHHAKHLQGLKALQLMKKHMDPPSWDWLEGIWNDYPDSVVEFTCYKYPVGDLGWNTIFWEIRNY